MGLISSRRARTSLSSVPASGKLDLALEHRTNDELGDLSNALEKSMELIRGCLGPGRAGGHHLLHLAHGLVELLVDGLDLIPKGQNLLVVRPGFRCYRCEKVLKPWYFIGSPQRFCPFCCSAE